MTAAFSSALSAAPAATASPAVTPAQETPATESSAPAAITQAAAEPSETAPVTTATTETPQAGEPPKWRWQDILANARETAAKEAEARIRQDIERQYDGLKDFAQIDAQERAGLLVLRNALAGDPQAIARIKGNPDARQAFQRLIAEEAAAQDAEPEPDLEAPDGTLVYSAQRQREWREWNNRQLEQRFSAKLQPLEQVAQTFQARETQARAFTEVGQVLTEFRADPDFTANEADIKAEISKDPRLAALADRDPKAALELAFARVYRAKVLPAQRKTSEADVLANLQQRAVAGTVNPSAATSSTPKKFSGFGEALQHFSATGR